MRTPRGGSVRPRYSIAPRTSLPPGAQSAPNMLRILSRSWGLFTTSSPVRPKVVSRGPLSSAPDSGGGGVPAGGSIVHAAVREVEIRPRTRHRDAAPSGRLRIRSPLRQGLVFQGLGRNPRATDAGSSSRRSNEELGGAEPGFIRTEPVRVTDDASKLYTSSPRALGELVGEEIGLVGQGERALHVASREGLSRLREKTLDRQIVLSLLPHQPRGVDLLHQPLGALDPTLRLALDALLFLGARRRGQ